MSKRKNAGLGYGYQFHGSFAKKADAVAKERKTKGAWVKSTLTNQGYRHIVMSPRTNPRKKRVKTPKTNPSELLVMGANPNPQEREITVPAGSTITIRMNPTKAICGHLIGGEVCTREPGHRGPHLPQGATMRPSSRLRRGWKPRAANPSAAALRESFTGMEADRFTITNEPHMPVGDYAQLGELLALYVKPISGGQVQQITFLKSARPLVVADETARQIYFAGGDQDLNDALNSFGAHARGGLFELGEVRRIDYKQRKEHVPDPDIDEWRHEFGEDSGVRPRLVFDPQKRRMLLEGGEYVVRAEGIVN